MPTQIIEQRIASDPRVIALAQSRKRGNLPGIVSGRELQQFGYDVQNDVKYTTNLVPRNAQNPTPGVFEETTKGDRILWAAAGAVGGYAAIASAAAPAAASVSTAGASGVPAATGPVAAAAGSGIGGTIARYGLQYGIPAATALYGQHMASSADRDAARIQADYLQRALDAEIEERNYRRRFDEEAREYERGRYGEERDYGRGQYANYLGRLDPYRATGTEALGRASSLLTSSSYRPELGQRGGMTPQGALVRMRAPDGSEEMVPENMAAHYARLGAARV